VIALGYVVLSFLIHTQHDKRAIVETERQRFNTLGHNVTQHTKTVLQACICWNINIIPKDAKSTNSYHPKKHPCHIDIYKKQIIPHSFCDYQQKQENTIQQLQHFGRGGRG